jgi:hypothetical protein
MTKFQTKEMFVGDNGVSVYHFQRNHLLSKIFNCAIICLAKYLIDTKTCIKISKLPKCL